MTASQINNFNKIKIIKKKVIKNIRNKNNILEMYLRLFKKENNHNLKNLNLM
jgi:hypothetical protein